MEEYWTTLCITTIPVMDWLICKYHEVFNIVNSDLSIDRDTKMAVSFSPNIYTTHIYNISHTVQITHPWAVMIKVFYKQNVDLT